MSTNASGSPVLSLLIPIYNVQRYLRECLDSALAQTLKDIEIICINDGSTDNSPAIIREYMDRDGRVKMIDKANSGYGDSMNHGLEMARGKYVGILESDDFIAPDALENLVSAADSNNADFAKANFDFYWSKPEERRSLHEMFRPRDCGKPVRTRAIRRSSLSKSRRFGRPCTVAIFLSATALVPADSGGILSGHVICL
ncbi:MAG: glycosyltransferase family 2 protein [Collinsella sp.]